MNKNNFSLPIQNLKRNFIEDVQEKILFKKVTTFFYLVSFTSAALFSSCTKQDGYQPDQEIKTNAFKASNDDSGMTDKEFLGSTNRFDFKTVLELSQARAATAKYRHFSKATADEYEDINVVVPNMGYHFMKSKIVDSTFDIKRPELLVYNKKPDGTFELVAIEYAVPISATPDKAPEGFTGSADVWERNEVFGLWLCHAWVWKFNPEGVFHETNPLVEVL